MAASSHRRRRWPWVLLGVLLLLVVVGWFALSRLDAILLTRAQTEADRYGERLGRKLQITDLSTRIFPTLGATVTGVEVGPADGESHRLAAIDHLEVSVAARPLIASRGQDVRVEGVEVRGVELNVVRFEDGSTNVSRLLERWNETAPAEETSEASETPAEEGEGFDFSKLVLDRAALLDATISLIDPSAPPPGTWTIHDLDVEVRDVRVGKALTVELSAGVLSEAQNLAFSLKTAPLGGKLEVVPESLTLKLEPLDLRPLARFIPQSGLLAGTVEADLEAALGALVPGGSGATRMVGRVEGNGLRFEGAEGGKALDVLLDTDVNGDVAEGNLRLETLVLRAGPATLTGKGSVEGLVGDHPRFDDFEIRGEGLDPEALSAYWPKLRELVGGVIAGPIGIDIRGSGDADAQALWATVDLTPVRLALPDTIHKAAGAPLSLNLTANGDAAGGGPLRFQADVRAAGADLRPMQLINKAPGQPLSLLATGTFAPGNGDTFVVDVAEFTLKALSDTLTGSARYTSGPALDFMVDLRSQHLDADRLLLSDEQILASGGKLPTPSDDPNRFDGARGDIRMQVGTLRFQEMDLQQVSAKLKMIDDRIEVESFSTSVFGGTVTADGSSVALGPLPHLRPFSAKVAVDNIDVSQALAVATDKRMLTGRFSGRADFDGTGYNKEALMERLTGALEGELVQGTLLGVDVLGSVVKPLAAAVPFANARNVTLEDATQLAADLPIGVTIKDGVAQLKKPITWTREGQARMSFDGGTKLDGTLDLDGRVELAPQLIHQLTGGRVTPTEPLPVQLALTGPAWKPVVEGLDIRPTAQALLGLAAGAAAESLLGKERTQQLKDAVGGGVDQAKEKARQEAEKAKQDAEKRAAEEKARLEAEARERLEAQRKKAEEEAKNRLKGVFGR